MHPKLIKANLALLEGSPAEAQRLLEAYRTEDAPNPDPDAALALWLAAHSRPTPEAVREGLRTLVSDVPPDNPYAQMAQAYLQDEAAHTTAPPSRSGRQPLLVAGLFTLVGMVVTLGLVALFNRAQPPPAANPTTAAEPALVPTAVADWPDTSQALAGEGYTARYPQGILNVLALENDSRRVVRTSDGTLATPIAGARFYALKLTFECRSGICDQPPQARLTVLLDDGTPIEPRSGLNVGGQDVLQAVALGRVTSGWLVFEIPLVSRVTGLVIAPRVAGEFEAVTIGLG